MRKLLFTILFCIPLAVACFLWVRYKGQEDIYYAKIQLIVLSACNQMMDDTYHQFLGDVGFAKKDTKGYAIVKGTVYFPNMAPQNIRCSMYFDDFLGGYDDNTVVDVIFAAANYAPKGFYSEGARPASNTKTTIKALKKEYPLAFLLSSSSSKKPTFMSPYR